MRAHTALGVASISIPSLGLALRSTGAQASEPAPHGAAGFVLGD